MRVVPGLSEASVTVPLIPTGVERLGTINNLDFRFGRVFPLGKNDAGMARGGV